MEVSISIFMGILYTFIIGMIEYFRLFYLRKKFETLDWFLIALGLFNGIGFSFVIWATYNGNNIALWGLKLLQYDIDLIIIYFVFNVILMFSVSLGWIFSNSLLKQNNKASSIYPKYGNTQKLYKKIRTVAWGMLIVAILSYTLYTRAYGGFTGLIYYSRYIRSSISVIANKFSFLQRFGGFAFFSSYLFFGLLIDKTTKNMKKKSNFIGFLISLLFSLYVLYTWVGRISFIVYLMTFLIGYLLYKNKSVFRLSRKLIILLIFGLWSIVFFDKVLNRSRVGISVIELFAKELSFPSASFITQFETSTYRWFKDLIVAPLYILPSRIWSNVFGIETASMINTIAFYGFKKGEGGVTGGIPVDLLTFSYMQSSVLGIVIIGFMCGVMLLLIQKNMNQIPIKSIRNVLLGNVILNVIILTILYGDPLHIITRNFNLIIGMILLKLSFKYKL